MYSLYMKDPFATGIFSINFHIIVSRKIKYYFPCFLLELLLDKMIEAMKSALNKNELRYLMKKFHFPQEKMVELEQNYHGRELIPQRVFAAMQFWKELYGPRATVDELIRILYLVGFEDISIELRNMKIISQRLRL